MKIWMLLACLGCLLADATVFAANVTVDDDDDEYEEIVVRRRKKKKKAPADAVVAPAAVAVPDVAKDGAPAVKAADEPPPPPEPPEADAAEPRRLVRYFCKAWKDKDYERLWWAMSPQYRKKVSLKKLKKLFKSDAEMNRGLIDENILEAAKTRDGNEGVKLELIFKFPRAKHRFVMAVAERQPGGAFRIVDSPFIPQDLDDL